MDDWTERATLTAFDYLSSNIHTDMHMYTAIKWFALTYYAKLINEWLTEMNFVNWIHNQQKDLAFDTSLLYSSWLSTPITRA